MQLFEMLEPLGVNDEINAEDFCEAARSDASIAKVIIRVSFARKDKAVVAGVPISYV